MLSADQISVLLKRYVKEEMGVDLIGFASADFSVAERESLGYFADFVGERRNGEMAYLNDFEKRLRPESLLEGAKSVVVIGLNYRRFRDKDLPKGWGTVARYAYGRDYHKVIRGVLKRIALFLNSLVPEANCRICVDSAPLMEKHFAVKAGLGFIGRNSTLINPVLGSFLLLGELITDVELVYDVPVAGTCGSCRRCIDGCPTKALIGASKMDARRCISYLTIEKKGLIDEEFKEAIGNRIFGCDSCQEFCPYNLKAESLVVSDDGILGKAIAGDRLCVDEILEMSDDDFLKKFAGSPVMRAKLSGLKRNAAIVKENLEKGLGNG